MPANVLAVRLTWLAEFELALGVADNDDDDEDDDEVVDDEAEGMMPLHAELMASAGIEFLMDAALTAALRLEEGVEGVDDDEAECVDVAEQLAAAAVPDELDVDVLDMDEVLVLDMDDDVDVLEAKLADEADAFMSHTLAFFTIHGCFITPSSDNRSLGFFLSN